MKTIPLTQDKVALVDNEDFERLSRHKWTAMNDHGIWRAYRKSKQISIYMHREVLHLTRRDKVQVDHVDRDGLNNQKHNLRKCTQSQNNSNTGLAKHNKSGYKGVRWNDGKYEANISSNNKTMWIGSYETAKQAAFAYDKEAKSLRGEFALTNQMLGLL